MRGEASWSTAAAAAGSRAGARTRQKRLTKQCLEPAYEAGMSHSMLNLQERRLRIERFCAASLSA